MVPRSLRSEGNRFFPAKTGTESGPTWQKRCSGDMHSELHREGLARYDLGCRESDDGTTILIDPVEEVSTPCQFFNTRVESDGPVLEFETAAGLNDFRNNALRDSLYELVSNRSEPRLAVDLFKVDYPLQLGRGASRRPEATRRNPTAAKSFSTAFNRSSATYSQS